MDPNEAGGWGRGAVFFKKSPRVKDGWVLHPHKSKCYTSVRTPTSPAKGPRTSVFGTLGKMGVTLNWIHLSRKLLVRHRCAQLFLLPEATTATATRSHSPSGSPFAGTAIPPLLSGTPFLCCGHGATIPLLACGCSAVVPMSLSQVRPAHHRLLRVGTGHPSALPPGIRHHTPSSSMSVWECSPPGAA